MQKRFCLCLPLLLAIFAGTLVSCSKNSEPPIQEERKNNITATWKVKDVTLAYAINFAGQRLPVGFSLYNVAPLLPVSGPKLLCAKEATFQFSPNYSYTITGCTDLIFPGAGQAGSWSLSLNGGIIKLGSEPYMTVATKGNEWTISNKVLILEADPNRGGAYVPVNITLEK